MTDLVISKKEPQTAYFSCDNGQMFAFDMNKQQTIRTFSGHRENQTVNCVKERGGSHPPGQLVSCSDDNSVLIWDSRVDNPIQTLYPHSDFSPKQKLSINTLELNDEGNWMACGGAGCLLTFYYLPSHAMTDLIPTRSPVSKILWDNHEKQFFCACTRSLVYSAEISGKFKTTFSSTVPYIFDCSFSEKRKNLAIVGFGSTIDMLNTSSNQTYPLQF